MNTTLLNQFLLAAAIDPWDTWHNVTRLIFADWLETEYGELDKAGTLRTMECEVADYIAIEGRITNWLVFPAANMDRALRVVVEGRTDAAWRTIADGDFALTSGYRRSLTLAHSMHEIRICLPVAPPDDLSYSLSAVEGTWHGWLSLDRAQRRCRRRVLEMFPDAASILKSGSSFTAERGLSVLEEYRLWDDSPRWVPAVSHRAIGV